MRLNQKSTIRNRTTEYHTVPVERAADSLLRDLRTVFQPVEEPGGEICLVDGPEDLPPECYALRVCGDTLKICARDELGFIYGIYAVSRDLLGVQDFWFWNDQPFSPTEGVDVPDSFCRRSRPWAVRFRGWFINDEVLLHTWVVDRRKDRCWEMVFEALLRCGGNLVIPGTDKTARKYRSLARDMGLVITHHHAEPLGAEMFARAYPMLRASYQEYPEKFQRLWERALEEQSDCKVIWNLGFRGQGDRPFWEDDPQYATAEARGALMSELIRVQYDMVRARYPEAVCATNLYGETMELYRAGHLRLPENVIKIWADNGFGAMVSRRQGNHNPRIPALPDAGGKDAHGIYYHASFYDLQAANHITMLPNSPHFVADTLEKVLDRGVNDLWIINCSNVKPHVFTLALIAEMWREGTADAEKCLHEYAAKYYGRGNAGAVAECFRSYYRAAMPYGPNEDDHAGEQFANYVLRMLVSQYMRDETRREPDLLWATSADTLQGQIQWYAKLCAQGEIRYTESVRIGEKTALALPDDTRCLLEDSVLLQSRIYYYCYGGAVLACRALQEALDGNLQSAFYLAGLARERYQTADTAMRDREHGKWHGFYANECLTDVKETAWLLGVLMGYLRNRGDGPHFYQWQREYLYAEEDTRVVLITNMENHLTNEELFALMKVQENVRHTVHS